MGIKLGEIKKQRLMRITPTWETCGGQGFKQLAAAGLAWLEQKYQDVNALNVFPVPDGDTGINMLLTMRSAWNEIVDQEATDVSTIATKLAQGAVMGSRGNSGVILSQLWLGFAQSVEGQASFDAGGMAKGLRRASQTADNVRGMKPIEGTILTVARDGAGAAEAAAKESSDLRFVLQKTTEEMQHSVQRTPDLLVKNGVYVLREAGVVDAGGLGLTVIMEGMLRYLNGEAVELSQTNGEEAVSLESNIDLSGLDFPYDVQFLLTGEALDIDAISAAIEIMGDSALVVGDNEAVKVHVHVVNPGEPLGYAASLGMLDDIVVENMAAQYQHFASNRQSAGEQQPAALAKEVQSGQVAVIAVAPGEGLKSVFYSLGAAHVIDGGQTMNPSTEDFIGAIKDLPTDKVILLPNNSNIFMAAQQAAENVEDQEVLVVSSRTIPQGVNALVCLDPAGDLHSVGQMMNAALASVATGEITRATRSVKLDGLSVNKGQLIGLHDSELRVSGDGMEDVMRRLLTEMDAIDLELITLYYGDSVSKTEVQAIAKAMQEQFPQQEFEIVHGGQPLYPYILSVE